MWGAIVGWLKSLFGGRGGTQIGQGNQMTTASTTGDNSPAVTAGRDVHFTMPSASASVDKEAETFAELEETLGDLLSDLRKQLADNPLYRDLIVLDKKTISYNRGRVSWAGRPAGRRRRTCPGRGRRGRAGRGKEGGGSGGAAWWLTRVNLRRWNSGMGQGRPSGLSGAAGSEVVRPLSDTRRRLPRALRPGRGRGCRGRRVPVV
jgi:hypothetical protein